MTTMCGTLGRGESAINLEGYRQGMKPSAGVAIVLGIFVIVAPISAAPVTPRPSIIVVLTDDLDARSIAFMPQLKSLLADQGLTFANFFVTTALCCPSRSSILRGQYVHNHQVFTNTPPGGGFGKFHDLGHEQSTVATWLRTAGYRTGLMGKYLNGYPDRSAPTYVPPGWDEWDSPARGGAYGNFNYTMNETGKLVDYGNRPDDYLTDVLARKAADFIRASSRDGRPFFLYLATYAPHAPATPAPRHQNAFASVTAPRPPSFNEADVGDKPAWVRNRPSLSDQEMARIDRQNRQRLRSLLAVDEMLAGLIDVLRQTGQLDRTYVFFTSDNGYHMGEHRLMPGKNTAYEEDIRVPLLVRGPGVPAGRTIEHLALNIDLAPTFAALAGATAPPFVDGRSLLPLLSPTAPPLLQWRQAFTVEHYADQSAEPGGAQPRQRRTRAAPELHALRTRTMLYVEYVTGERELYDLQQDPYELQNRASTAAPDLLARLSARLAELQRCASAGCRAAEDAP